MATDTTNPLMDDFMATGDAVSQARPEVDAEMIREIFEEAATMLHNGLALDGLDDHDTQAVIAGLCIDLCAEDLRHGEAVRARSRAALDEPGDLHDPEAVSASYLISAAILQL